MDMEIVLGDKQIVKALYKGFEVITDQPEKAGGDNSAPSPFDLFLVSLGACAGYYVKSFCRQRQLPETGIRLVQKTRLNPETRMIDQIDIEIKLPADFPDKYREALVKAAEACTVKKHVMMAPAFSIFTVKE